MSSKIKKISIEAEGIGNMELYVTLCQVSSRARMIKHPVESGSQVFDNKVLEPRTITIHASVYADDTGLKQALRKLWRNRKFEFYTIRTREATYKNFACTECSHTEGTEKLDILEYTIQFEEVMKAKTRYSAMSPDDANVVS